MDRTTPAKKIQPSIFINSLKIVTSRLLTKDLGNHFTWTAISHKTTATVTATDKKVKDDNTLSEEKSIR